MNDINELMGLIKKACQLFREHGTPDTAALSLERGAKYFYAIYILYMLNALENNVTEFCRYLYDH